MKNNMLTRMLIIIPMYIISVILLFINMINILGYFITCVMIAVLQIALIIKQYDALLGADE